MHNTTLVGESHVGTSQDVIGDGLTEDFYAEDVGDAAIVRLSSEMGMRVGTGMVLHFLCLALQIRVHDCDMVVAADDVTEGTETLFYPLDLH